LGKSDPFKALALAVSPDDDALMIGGDAWPAAVDRRNPKLPFWPDASRRYATVAVRLPKAKDELAMLLHAAAAVLKPDGALCLFGGNDEGIASARAQLEELFANVEVAAVKHHARVFLATAPRDAVRGALADWRRVFTFESGGLTFQHLTYPGVFARDRLDDGTAMLLEHLPPLHGRILDFGAGSGAISQVVSARYEATEITMADIDAIALRAAVENVPVARASQITAPQDLGHASYDMIISNPPVHTGVSQDFSMLRALLATAPALLVKGGQCFLVLQSKVPLLRFAPRAQRIATERGYAVWSLQP
jgi:16S rRNA (guanine1207-N2)-methyltransferase